MVVMTWTLCSIPHPVTGPGPNPPSSQAGRETAVRRAWALGGANVYASTG
jgi:hypothetical protein